MRKGTIVAKFQEIPRLILSNICSSYKRSLEIFSKIFGAGGFERYSLTPLERGYSKKAKIATVS
jgi:hypothetical protein